MEYTEEKLNYFRICYITTDVLTEGLRSIFKQEWDNLFKTTVGKWKDEPRNGMDFYNGESPRNHRRHAHLLATMKNGNRAEWDCTMLFYAILYSDCIHSLNPIVQSSVDDLRKFRNEEFAHMPKGHLSDPDFQIAINKVQVAFQALGLSTLQIQEIINQRNFPTEELRNVLKKADDLKQELQEKEKEIQDKGKELEEKGKELEEKGKELEEKGKELQDKEEQRQVLQDQLHSEISSFCILPPKPSHDVAARDCEVAEITQKLKELKSVNESKLSCLYISGNPGSGKSQLAGLVAKRFYDEVKEMPGATSFVMTVNAESPHTLLESYVSFARHLKSPEYAVTNTRNAKDMTTEEKISSLKSLISTKIELYTSWLLVVDNVPSLSSVHVHLPEPGNEQWARGQLLITTQDTQCIPLTSSFTQHVSVSKGMNPYDASILLANLSGITGSEIENDVAQTLDFQPLALASAATYVRAVRQNKSTSNFGWKDFLKKLEKGKRSTTETILAETNPSYPNSMTAATALAVANAMTSDKVIHHTFSFLSLCAPQPLSLDIVVSYILNIDKEIQDKEMISMRIQRCSLLLFEEDESGVYIRQHQVVHDVINTVMKVCQEDSLLEAVSGAIRSFNQYIGLQNDDLHLDSLVNSRHIVPHLAVLINTIEKLFRKQDKHRVLQGSIINVQDYPRYFQTLGKMCARDSAFDAAKKYFDAGLEVIQRCDVFSDVDLADAYYWVGNINYILDNFHEARKHLEYGLGILKKNVGSEHVDVALIYSCLGSVYRQMDDMEPAKECLDRALAIRIKILGPEHVDVADTYNNLATVHSLLGDLEQAKEYLEQSQAIRLKKLDSEHIDVAITCSNLAAAYSDLNDLEQAKEYHDRALAIRLKRLGPEHVDVARTYNSLGVLYSDLGGLEQAKEYHNRALAIRLKRLGPEHVDVALSYTHLGAVYSDLGDLKMAKEYYERALAIRMKRLGPEHDGVASSYNDLGGVNSALGDLEQAKEYFERSLAILLERHGPEHVEVSRSYDNLANVYRCLGDQEQTKEYHERALAIHLKRLGPEHVNVGVSYNNLATVYIDLGDLKQAKEYYERALAILLKRLGSEHADVARSYDNLAVIYRIQGDLEQAKEYNDRALAILLKRLGPEHIYVAHSYKNLATVYRDLGDLEQAKEYYERALAIRMKRLGPEHVDVALSYNNLAAVYRDLGDLKQAKEYHERELAIHLKRLGPEHVYVALSYINLATVYSDLGDLIQAKEYYERALAIQLKRLGPDHVNVGLSYHNLTDLYSKEGDVEQAKMYFERALGIYLRRLGPDHVDVATYYNGLAAAHSDLGDVE